MKTILNICVIGELTVVYITICDFTRLIDWIESTAMFDINQSGRRAILAIAKYRIISKKEDGGSTYLGCTWFCRS